MTTDTAPPPEPAPAAGDGALDVHAIVEMLGHRRLAGRVREVQIAGAGMLRVDVPTVGTRPGRTLFVAPGSLYALHPVDEATALAAAGALGVTVPLQPWELHQIAATHADHDEHLDDEDAGPGEEPPW